MLMPSWRHAEPTKTSDLSWSGSGGAGREVLHGRYAVRRASGHKARRGDGCGDVRCGQAASLLYQQRKESIEDELLRCDHGAYLVGIGYEQDVRYCSRQSVLSVVPKVYDRRVIRKAHGGKEE